MEELLLTRFTLCLQFNIDPFQNKSVISATRQSFEIRHIQFTAWVHYLRSVFTLSASFDASVDARNEYIGFNVSASVPILVSKFK